MRRFFLLLIFLATPLWACAQTCPSGTTPLPWGVTRDPATDQLRQIFCKDKNGRISTTSLASASSGVINGVRVLDGVTFTTLQAAIDDAPAGGRVYVPEGQYTLTTGVTISKHLVVECANRGNAQLEGAVFRVNAAITAVTISSPGVFIDGCSFTRETGFAGTIPAIIAATAAHGSVFRNLVLGGANTADLDLNSTTDVTVESVIFNARAAQTGIGLRVRGTSGASTIIKVYGCQFNNYNYGITFNNVCFLCLSQTVCAPRGAVIFIGRFV